MLNRSQVPEYNSLILDDFIAVEEMKLDNGVGVSVMRGGTQEVVKIDFVFPSGTAQANKPLLASTTGNLLLEGTNAKSSLEISNILDSYGAYFSVSSFFHSSVATLFTLSKHLHTLIPFVKELIYESIFPQEELDIYLDKKRQEFFINRERVNYLSALKFKEVVFGVDNVYGQSVNINDFNKINRNEIVKFHKEYYLENSLEIIVSGLPSNDVFDILNSNFGYQQRDFKIADVSHINISSSSEKKHFVEKKDALQCAIKIGRPIFNNLHPDFLPLTIVNTILGGYFGSRLMTSVREEKGLTYGIGSSLQSFKHSGLLTISTEVAVDKYSEAVDAIFLEIEKLRTEKISLEELDVVKNYMIGELMRRFDGPYSTADIFRSLKENSLGLDYYKQLEKSINTITPEIILELSKEYLQKDNFFVIIVGVNQ